MKQRTKPSTWVADNAAQALLPKDQGGMSRWIKVPLILIIVYLLVALVLGFWWSVSPAENDLDDVLAESKDAVAPTGYATTAMLSAVASTLLDKPGGWIDNDKTPPGIWLDNMPNFEVGALFQLRDLTQVMRDDFSRSQSQSTENEALVVAHTRFNVDTQSWLFPAAESEYREAIKNLHKYLESLQASQQTDAQFFARADNLRVWLARIEKRMGSLSQRLSASVGQRRINTDLANDPAAEQSTQTPAETEVKTSFWKIDDVFYEARGACWALLQLLRAAEVDFAAVLEKKGAQTSLKQIIRELEATQHTVWSPMIMNGSGFGTFANHSLVMASYISRANAALIDLRELLEQG